jgi:hypothetical protein
MVLEKGSKELRRGLKSKVTENSLHSNKRDTLVTRLNRKLAKRNSGNQQSNELKAHSE